MKEQLKSWTSEVRCGADVQDHDTASLYNLSDAAVEFQVKDRLSFMRFLNLSLADRVPDEKGLENSVWR